VVIRTVGAAAALRAGPDEEGHSRTITVQPFIQAKLVKNGWFQSRRCLFPCLSRGVTGSGMIPGGAARVGGGPPGREPQKRQ